MFAPGRVKQQAHQLFGYLCISFHLIFFVLVVGRKTHWLGGEEKSGQSKNWQQKIFFLLILTTSVNLRLIIQIIYLRNL